MPIRPLQSASVRFFALLRRMHARAERLLELNPRLRAWIYPLGLSGPELQRREYNGQMFADFHEQERMLADTQRMAFYTRAIARHVQPGDRVVDLGTGTGILAALAARRGASKVYAVDHSEILGQAKELARANGVERVEFISAHSSAFTTDAPLDVILHEQMGDCLFDEGMIASVSDLRDRLLKPGGIILPSNFEFFCEPVMIRDDRLVPFIWELNVEGYDYSCLERSRPQNPGYYNLASSDLGLVDHFLGESEPVLRVDLMTVKEGAMPRQVTFSRKVTRPGRLDGYAVFFRVQVDRDLVLSSSPLDPRRAPHWGFRILRTERDDFGMGDEMSVSLSVGSWSDPDTWRWSHQKRACSGLGLAGLPV